MNQMQTDHRRPQLSTRVLLFVVAVFAAVTLPTAAFGAKSLQERYDDTQAKVEQAQQKEGVLTSQISTESRQLATLTSEVNALKSHEARVVAKSWFITRD
jgi:cell division protein FtsB